jgi:hypothetical protein
LNGNLIYNDNIFPKHVPQNFWTKFVTPGTEFAGKSSFSETLPVTQIWKKYYDIKVLRDLDYFFDALQSLALNMRIRIIEAE